MVDTRTDAGAAALAAVSPLGKVPVIEVDGAVIPDSAVIIAWLWARHGEAVRAAGFRLDPVDIDDRVLTAIVDGALDAAINRFYLRRDGFDDRGYVGRQGDRALAALDWMVFRQVVHLTRYQNLVTFRDEWAASGVGAGNEPA
jgi:glutathione S-transferase